MSMSTNDLDTVFDDSWGEHHRSGMVAVVGRPNVGKSTLINRIVGEKIAIVSPKPQTTRKRQLGIYTTPDAQILFIDTPGLHAPQHKLGEMMVRDAESAFRDADLILVLLEVSTAPGDAERMMSERIAELHGETPVVLALNKADLLSGDELTAYAVANSALFPFAAKRQLVSAVTGEGVPDLLAQIIELLPLGPRYFPEDQLSEASLRFIAAETVREKIMLHTEQEIPHSVAVDIESYQERPDGTHYVSAVIYVERDSQKGIVIGKGGEMIKRIGMEARTELETMTDARIFLDLRVKVLENWRKDEKMMSRLGYRPPKEDE
ncbi:MAG: GTPase Era [bacterium]|nr:GTPase Era [bacterium]